MTAVVIGSTGEVGRHALVAALGASFTRVVDAGRKSARDLAPSPLFQLASAPGVDKLDYVKLDFEKLCEGDAAERAKLSGERAQVVLIALGTSRAAAGSAEVFERIDRTYVVEAARACLVPGSKQTLVYCSSVGSSPTSRFLYTRSKGLTEVALAGLGYETTVILRPGMLECPDGRYAKKNAIEGLAARITGWLGVGIKTTAVGQAMARLAESPEGTVAKGFGQWESLGGERAWTMTNSQLLAYAKAA